MKIKADVSKTFLEEETLSRLRPEADRAIERLWSGKEEFTGWVRLPLEEAKKDSEFMAEVGRILETADEIQARCELFVVIGIGGSYLGARAAIEAMGGLAGYPEIRFAGNNLSGTYHAEILDEVLKKDTCICVISKSGTTIEPSIAFSVLKEVLMGKYGEEEAKKRIYAITDRSRGVLREECDREGYTSFVVPDDIGGRYSVLSAVGLLPMAVAGIDIRAMLRGALDCACDTGWDFDLPDYAITRYAMMQAGKNIEIFEFYEPKLYYFTEWLKQLFGESEGKEGKGLYPASLGFTTDLHSMGQFLQEGSRIFFETVLNLQTPEEDVQVPADAGAGLSGKRMNEVNRAAMEGVITAHRKAGIPVVKIDIPELSPGIFGELIYYFETTCAITAYMMGVNPFNQPGVEAYKEEIRNILL